MSRSSDISERIFQKPEAEALTRYFWFRYQSNREILRDGMARMGFQEFLSSEHKGYIITSYHFPSDPNFNFEEFYNRLNELDMVIYPGKVTEADCFRIGNIGDLHAEDMENLLGAIEKVCADMNINLPLH